MASSYTEGKSSIVGWLEEIKPETVIDVGPGCGTYWAILNGVYGTWVSGFTDYKGKKPKMHAVEAFYPYIDMYALRDKYDEVVVADVKYLDWDKMPVVDVVIFGDILEHLLQEEAMDVVAGAKLVTDNIIISLPIIHFPQGAIGGNTFERHKEEDWTHERMLKVFGEPHMFVAGSSIGTYWYKYD